VKHGYAEANAVVELQGLKMAENRTFADIARYVLMTVLGLTLPAPKDVTKENLKLYPSAPPATAAELLKSAREKVARWAPLLARFLKSEDDQVEMLLTLEEYCSEDEVFRGMGGALLVPAFAKILHMLYDMDVLSEVSVLAWAREKEGAEEEDKKFLALAAPFVAWLKEADEESEDSDEASEDSDSDE
jgi:translation initiation factor eIF-2B subunit epsilon